VAKYPYTRKPEDITRFLEKIITLEVPSGKIDAGYIRSLGFSSSSSNYLLDILKKLGFLNEKDEPSGTWVDYVTNEKRGLVLASAIKNAYEKLFDMVFCPYLEADETIIEIFQHEEPDTSNRDMGFLVETFRSLSSMADFQDVMSDEPASTSSGAVIKDEKSKSVRIDPNLQMNIQIHIDPDTPDEKIEVIFKNMRKYLLGKD